MKAPVLALALLVAACSSQAPKSAPKAEVAPNMPDLSATLDGQSLRVSYLASSGGSSLQIVDVKRDGDITVVRLRLTSPAAGAEVTQAFETHDVDAKLPTGEGTIHVLLQQRRAKEQYEVEPGFALAKIIER